MMRPILIPNGNGYVDSSLVAFTDGGVNVLEILHIPRSLPALDLIVLPDDDKHILKMLVVGVKKMLPQEPDAATDIRIATAEHALHDDFSGDRCHVIAMLLVDARRIMGLKPNIVTAALIFKAETFLNISGSDYR